MRKFFDRLGEIAIWAAVPVFVWGVWDWSALPWKIMATLVAVVVVCSFLAQDENGNYPD